MINLLLNYLFIQITIILFMLPFYLWYKETHYKDEGVKVSLNRHLELFFSSPQANFLVFFWAMGEALIWFVIPEFLLLLIIFMRIKKKTELLIFDIYGTATGIIIALLFPVAKSSISALPYVTQNMVAQTEVWYEKMGVFALLNQPFTGVPFKVFTHLASYENLFILGFIFFAIAVRISRYALFYLVLSGVYNALHKVVYKNYIILYFVATVIFSLLLLRVVSIFGPGYTLQI